MKELFKQFEKANIDKVYPDFLSLVTNWKEFYLSSHKENILNSQNILYETYKQDVMSGSFNNVESPGYWDWRLTREMQYDPFVGDQPINDDGYFANENKKLLFILIIWFFSKHQGVSL